MMKKINEFAIVHKDKYALRYADGVPAAEKKHFWAQSPWNAFRLLLPAA